MMSKCVILAGMCVAAGGARAATEVITDDFTFQQTNPGGSFILASTSPSDTVSFDTALGNLNSVEIQWNGVTLTETGTVKSSAILGGLISGLANGDVTVNGQATKAGVPVILSVSGLKTAGRNKPISFSADGNSSDQTFDAADDFNGIFTEAAAGDALDIEWNIGKVATISASSLGSTSALLNSGVTLSSAELTADLTVTFNYSAVPEPSTWAMMLAGFAGLGFVGYRSRKRAVAA